MCHYKGLYTSGPRLHLPIWDEIQSPNGVPMFPGNERPQFPDKIWNIAAQREQSVEQRFTIDTRHVPGARDLAQELNNVDDGCEGTPPQQEATAPCASSGTNDIKQYSRAPRAAPDGPPAARVLFGTVGPRQEALDIFLTNTEQKARRDFSDKWGFDVAVGAPQEDHAVWKWDKQEHGPKQ
eukprot:jgi/Botrbrau1/14349/Bobra.0014s0006.1